MPLVVNLRESALMHLIIMDVGIVAGQVGRQLSGQLCYLRVSDKGPRGGRSGCCTGIGIAQSTHLQQEIGKKAYDTHGVWAGPRVRGVIWGIPGNW